MDKFVLDKINEKPAVLFKYLINHWYNPLTYSVLFKDWYVREEGYRISEIHEAAKHYPQVVSEIANFVAVLEEKFSDEKYDYKNETYVSLAIKLHKKYKERLLKYLTKKVKEYELEQIRGEFVPESIFKELVYRGFIPHEYLRPQLKAYYIVASNVGKSINLIYPKYFTTHEDALKGLENFGMPGITTLTQYP